MKSTQAFHAKDRLEIRYAFLPVLAATILQILFAGWLCYWISLAMSGHVVLVFAALLAVGIGGPLALSFLPAVVHGWRHRGPVVIFDLDGVTDVRKEHSFVPWSDIDGIDLGRGNRASFLCFRFRRPSLQREDAPRFGMFGRILKRAATLGDWNISLRLLACGKSAALASAKEFRQLSIRQHVVESVAWHTLNQKDA